MILRAVSLMTFFLSVAAFADDADKAKLAGAWELQAGTDTDGRITWVLEAKGDTWHVSYSEGNQKPAQFECATDGRECAVKTWGHAAKVSFWFNGPKLVELETKGQEVIKRRFAIAERGDEMEVEVIPIVSSAKAETLHFKRANSAATK
jgi:hypothetical protein